MLHTLNLYNSLCQLYLNNAGKNMYYIYLFLGEKA